MSVILFKSSSVDDGKVRGVATLVSSLGEGSEVSNPVGLGDSSAQISLNTLAERLSGVQTVNCMLTDVSVSSAQVLRSVLEEKDYVSGSQTIVASVGDLDSTFPTTDWDILLDGISIKNQIHAANINQPDSAVHNELSLDSIDAELFLKANPSILTTSPRLEVRLDARRLFFLLETKEGDEVGFSLWGRSVSALDDVPFADSVQVLLNTPTSAQAVCAGLLTVNNIDWQIMDWALPAGYEYHGDAMGGISEIAGAVGGIVRSKDDGTLLVRYRYPVRPVRSQSSPAQVSYDRVSNIITLNYSGEKGTGQNAVVVYGNAADVDRPYIEVESKIDADGKETTSFETGDDVYLRIYWGGFSPRDIITATSAGIIRFISQSEGTFTEDVVFDAGKGSVTRPIENLRSVQWIGYSSDPIHWIQNSSDLTVDDPRWVIGKVTYTSKYWRYLVTSHQVSQLIAALEYAGAPGVSVLVQFGAGDNLAEAITNNNLTTLAAARQAGVSHLDDVSYDKQVVTVSTPYDEDAVDGNLASVSNDRVGISGNFYIRTVTTEFAGPQIKQSLELIKCVV